MDHYDISRLGCRSKRTASRRFWWYFDSHRRLIRLGLESRPIQDELLIRSVHSAASANLGPDGWRRAVFL